MKDCASDGTASHREGMVIGIDASAQRAPSTNNFVAIAWMAAA